MAKTSEQRNAARRAQRAAAKAAQNLSETAAHSAAALAELGQQTAAASEREAMAAAGLQLEDEHGNVAEDGAQDQAQAESITGDDDTAALMAKLGLIDEDAQQQQQQWANSVQTIPPNQPMPAQETRAIGEARPRTLPENVQHAEIIEDVAQTAAMSLVPTPRNRFADRPAHAPIGIDSLTQRIGASWYVEGHWYDWMRNGHGEFHQFSRWYPEQRLLVDFFRGPSVDVEAEVTDKIAQLEAFNEKAAAHERIGYVGLYVGDTPTDNTLLAALDGQLFAPPLKAPVDMPFATAEVRM